MSDGGVDLVVLGSDSGALCGYGFADFLFGRGGGTCSPVLFFMTFKKCFCAWLRICGWWRIAPCVGIRGQRVSLTMDCLSFTYETLIAAINFAFART